LRDRAVCRPSMEAGVPTGSCNYCSYGQNVVFLDKKNALFEISPSGVVFGYRKRAVLKTTVSKTFEQTNA
jgi:formylmethanofuran dehydrogenase subunit A